jgi:hypothetical protein
VGYRADLQNLRTSHISPREELMKHLLLKDRRKTGGTKTEPLLKYQHQGWMLKE